MSKLLWSPNKINTNLDRFIHEVNKLYGLSIEDYNELYKWSINYPVNFWSLLAEFARIEFSEPPKSILSQKDSNSNSNDITNYKWFDGAKLNFAENLLRFRDEKIALIEYNEHSDPKYISYQELFILVAKCAEGLKKLGVVKGDRVAGFITNSSNAVIAMLATSSLGAVWSSCSPDFGASGVLDRFQQIKPKVLIANDSYMYNGKVINLIPILNELSEQLPSLVKIITISHFDDKFQIENRTSDWNEFINNDAEEIDFIPVDFNDPLYIMYSSGTTGVPKCIVHGVGGTLIQHFKELSLHTNLTDNDTIFYFTTCGWMMWNWLVSALFIGAKVVIFDGSPAYPNLRRLWEIAEKEKISIFGTSPKYLSTCEKSGLIPKNEFDLNSLQTILSTGSPLSEENFEWVYENVKADLQLSSISGGTDIISCFMLGNPKLPVYSGEIQCRGLGMKVEAWDENGKSLINEKGELVCTLPFPSMPIYFWNDPDNSKYKNAYFEFYIGVWHHGDYIRINENGGVTVFGRSDATLNPGGVRIGTAEIYKVVEQIEGIADSVVVGKEIDNDIKVILFVVLKNDVIFDDSLKSKINIEIKSKLTPRHLPFRIYQVKEIPYTLNGKKVELAILKTLNGEEVKNKASIINPDSLKQFENLSVY